MGFYDNTPIKMLEKKDFKGKTLKTNGKWMLVEIYSGGCPACVSFKDEFIELARFLHKLRSCKHKKCLLSKKINVAAISLQSETKGGKELQESLKDHVDSSNYIPEVILYNEKGKNVGRYEGNRTVEDILNWIFQTLENN
jgi:thiol-disulfide isomerase/thioredoxin